MRISSKLRKAVLLTLVLTATVAHGAERVKNQTSEESLKTEVKTQKNNEKEGQVLASDDLMINFKSDIITLSYINKAQEKTAFKIIDNAGSTVYRMKPSSDFIVHQRLITSKLPEGKYYASLVVGDEEFKKSIYVMR